MAPPILLLDGGLGTSLEDKYGVTFTHDQPLWSSDLLITSPSTLVSCQRDFCAAGVDVLLTATYQVSIEGFGRTKTAEFPNGIPKDAIGRYLRVALDVAEKAKTSQETSLALSLGPYGACMVPGQEYSGKYDADHDGEEDLFKWHLERLQLFTAEEGLLDKVQYVAIETVPRLDEIRAARRAVRAAGIEKAKVWISCVFPGENDALPDGSSIEQVVEAMLGPLDSAVTPWGIGINCTKIHKLRGLIAKFEDAINRLKSDGKTEASPSLVLYPDGTNGEVYNTTTKKWEKPEGLGDDKSKTPWEVLLAAAVKESQARGCFESYLVGGCCKASHEDIERLGHRLKSE